jgi:hypothetical protein
MQRSSSSLPFKQTLIGASPITDANFKLFRPRSSARSERHFAKVKVAGAIPAVDTNPNASVPQKRQDEFRKLVFVGASPTRGSSLRPAGYGPAGQFIRVVM